MPGHLEVLSAARRRAPRLEPCSGEGMQVSRRQLHVLRHVDQRKCGY